MSITPRRSSNSKNSHRPASLEPLEQRALLVADPVTVAHPMWFATYGAVVVDGEIDADEWAGAIAVTRAQASRADSAVTMRIKYTELGLYIAADVRDQYLWADGDGGGRGARTSWTNDDALGLFFDASVTRKRLLTPAGRALMFNIGAMNGAASGSGVVSRYNYIRGNNPTGIDGDLVGVALNPGGAPTVGMVWKTVLHGTPNNNSDIDQGWTTEAFLPWSTVNMAGMPVNGQNITMNFTVMFDDNNSTHNATERDTSPNAAQRFGPRIADDQINGVDSSFNQSSPGMEGPIDYAWLTFVDPRTDDRPNPLINPSAGKVDGYSARLNFLAPAASSAVMALGPAKRGGVYQYQIRWSETPISSALDWDSATEVANAFVPHPRGQAESLRIGGLEPGLTYYVAVRAVDAAGRLSAIQQITFTTLDESQDTSGGQRLMTSAQGGTLVTESGMPFFMVGSEGAPSDLYVRNLYPGDVWDAGNQELRNYESDPGEEGDALGYFDALASYGVNTLRVSLEQLAVPGAGQAAPSGLYWLESPAGTFNPDMRQFLWNMMEVAYQSSVRLVLQPWDTANYKALFDLTAYAASNGGPLTTINDFFQSATVITMLANRMNTIIDWVNQSPYASSVLAIELPEGWDSTDWTINARGNGDPTRAQEMRDRSKVVLRVAAAVHAHEPNMLLALSSDDVDPRGPVARALFLGDNIDLLTPHWYTASTAEPVNSPDANASIRPVTDYGAIAGYWTSSKRDQRVVNNGEWGFDAAMWPGESTYYSDSNPGPNPDKPWTLQDDIDLYRTTTWTQIALGLGGSGIRIGSAAMHDLLPADMRPDTTGYMPTPLPEEMRAIQLSASQFSGDGLLGFDYGAYRATTLAGRIGFAGTGNRLIGVGSTDGQQGMVYVLQDLNRTSGSVTGAQLLIDGLAEGEFWDIEFWSTGSFASLIDMRVAVEVIHGRLSVDLPDFDQDVMIRFKVESW